MECQAQLLRGSMHFVHSRFNRFAVQCPSGVRGFMLGVRRWALED